MEVPQHRSIAPTTMAAADRLATASSWRLSSKCRLTVGLVTISPRGVWARGDFALRAPSTRASGTGSNTENGMSEHAKPGDAAWRIKAIECLMIEKSLVEVARGIWTSG
jgi:hypothetical protein